jgi:hypothetical protein
MIAGSVLAFAGFAAYSSLRLITSQSQTQAKKNKLFIVDEERGCSNQKLQNQLNGSNADTVQENP